MFSTRICVDRLVLLSRCNFAEKLLTSFSSVKAWRKVVPKHATINKYHAPSWSKKINDPKLRPESEMWKNPGQFRNQTSARILSSIGQKKLLGVICINRTIFIPMQTPLPIKVGRRSSETDALPKWNPSHDGALPKFIYPSPSYTLIKSTERHESFWLAASSLLPTPSQQLKWLSRSSCASRSTVCGRCSSSLRWHDIVSGCSSSEQHRMLFRVRGCLLPCSWRWSPPHGTGELDLKSTQNLKFVPELCNTRHPFTSFTTFYNHLHALHSHRTCYLLALPQFRTTMKSPPSPSLTTVTSGSRNRRSKRWQMVRICWLFKPEKNGKPTCQRGLRGCWNIQKWRVSCQDGSSLASNKKPEKLFYRERERLYIYIIIYIYSIQTSSKVMIHTIFHQIVDQFFELPPLFWEIVEQGAELGPGQDAHFANLIWPPGGCHELVQGCRYSLVRGKKGHIKYGCIWTR